MEVDKDLNELGDKKSYAGIPEAEFVVSYSIILFYLLSTTVFKICRP